MPKISPKDLVLEALFGRWRPAAALQDGYSVLLPMPMDMPFLLWFALAALRQMETAHCNQVIVIPDGWGSDRGEGMRRVVQSFADPRILLSRLPRMVDFLIHKFQRVRSHGTAANWLHWAAIVEGTNCANSKYAFLHDADAFFIDPSGLEQQYAECRDRQMTTLGVEYRADAFFSENGYKIPGTWEMMYSVPWARSRSPLALKGKWRDTPRGRHEFDTMLYAQYLDYTPATVGAMAAAPPLVHFHATIITYRVFTDRKNGPVSDDLFRLLLLSILQELVPQEFQTRILPTPTSLAKSLGDPAAPIRYDSARAVREYSWFRQQMEELVEAPVFAGERADRIRQWLHPFDQYFSARTGLAAPQEDITANPRRHGLG